MEINVCTRTNCTVVVEEAIQEGGYLPESSTAIVKNKFRYKDTVSIDVLTLNKSTGEEVQSPVFTIRDSQLDQVKLPITFDGWFTVCHIVIPSKQWFDAATIALTLYDVVYYSDGVNVYKYVDGESTLTTVDEIIARNTEGTTISIVKKNYISVCYLRKCYINLCQQLFNSNTQCVSSDNSELIFQRDTVWMALNVIKYLTEFNQLAEAERIIEKLNSCNGLCKTTLSKQGCGCS